MSKPLTPCVGKCSTVFGDSVCRGCRRFSFEVIDWNKYSTAQTVLIWQRLDQQIDQIVLPLLDVDNIVLVQQFLDSRLVRLPKTASKGRIIFEALRICKRAPAFLVQSGLSIDNTNDLETIWYTIDRRLYALAVASYEMAWLRAATFGLEEASPHTL